MQAGPRALYDAVLGDTMQRFAEPIRSFHRAASPARYAGRAIVERGENPLARLLATIMGLPRSSCDCPIEIEVTHASNGSETWSRSFAGKPFVSRQEAGRGSWSGQIVERIGPMAFAYAITPRDGAAHLQVKGWTALGIPMPLALGPRVTAFEHSAADRFNFDVDMALPLIGRIVRYRGWLIPAA